MDVKLLDVKGTWAGIKGACRSTIGKEGSGIEPSSDWKRRRILSEHSPIRKMSFNWKWIDLRYWVSTHYVRHKFGIEHWISTQRTDRTGTNRNDIGQGALVTHEAEANTQALITISRKRLCVGASPETTEAWKALKGEIAKVEPELARCMVRDCVYRGHCYEMYSCGFHKKPAFQKELQDYREGIN